MCTNDVEIQGEIFYLLVYYFQRNRKDTVWEQDEQMASIYRVAHTE